MNLTGILHPRAAAQASAYESMTLRPIVAAVLASILFAFSDAKKGFCSPAPQSSSPPDSRQLLQKLADFSPDPCGPPYGREQDWHSGDAELRLFDQAQQAITQQLNASVEASSPPRDRAEEALKKLGRMSAEINAAWPEENRFRFQILDLSPVLLVKMGIRMHETFFVFGISEEEAGKANRLWRDVGSGDASAERSVPQSSLDIYPLHRGPSGNVRFLARFGLSGCAGPTGVEYDAREWNPEGIGDLQQVIKLAGSFGLDDKVPGFTQIGELRTENSLITLPFCWFSRIDTWDNPSLCAVDTYDISGDDIQFRSRIYNRPDLVPIAKALEYAQQRDYPALLGYCASSKVARNLVRGLPPYVFPDNLRVTRTGIGKEHVKLGYGSFDVEKRARRWLVVAFHPQ